MNKLAAIALKHKALKYGIPPNQGWITRQQAARQLGQPERNVHDLLRDAIEARDIETKKFSDWDAATMRPVQVTCYRIIEPGTPKPAKSSPQAIAGIPAHLLDRVQAVLGRHRGKTPSQLADLMRFKGEPRISAKAIRSLLDKPPQNRK